MVDEGGKVALIVLSGDVDRVPDSAAIYTSLPTITSTAVDKHQISGKDRCGLPHFFLCYSPFGRVNLFLSNVNLYCIAKHTGRDMAIEM